MSNLTPYIVLFFTILFYLSSISIAGTGIYCYLLSTFNLEMGMNPVEVKEDLTSLVFFTLGIFMFNELSVRINSFYCM